MLSRSLVVKGGILLHSCQNHSSVIVGTHTVVREACFHYCSLWSFLIIYMKLIFNKTPPDLHFIFEHFVWLSLVMMVWIICISINIYLVSVFSMKHLWFIRDGCLYFVLIIGCYWKDEFHWFCRWLRTLLAQTLDCQQGLCWAAINGGESSPLLFYLLQPALIETCNSSGQGDIATTLKSFTLGASKSSI